MPSVAGRLDEPLGDPEHHLLVLDDVHAADEDERPVVRERDIRTDRNRLVRHDFTSLLCRSPRGTVPRLLDHGQNLLAMRGDAEIVLEPLLGSSDHVEAPPVIIDQRL